MLKTLLLSLLVFPYPAQEASLVPLEPLVRYVVTGKVLDDTDGSAITGADILVTDLDDKVVANSTSDTLGVFSVDRIPSGDVLVLVKMMGYDSFVSDKITFGPGSPEKFDLGVIRLPRSAEGLREVTVVGEKNRIVYKLDRQLISASSSVTSAGLTAFSVGVPKADGAAAPNALFNSPEPILDFAAVKVTLISTTPLPSLIGIRRILPSSSQKASG